MAVSGTANTTQKYKMPMKALTTNEAQLALSCCDMANSPA